MATGLFLGLFTRQSGSRVFSLLLLLFALNLALADDALLRTWKDVSGKFSLKARFVACEDYQVKLKQESGDEITVPLTALCQADRDYVRVTLDDNSKVPAEFRDVLARFQSVKDKWIANLEEKKGEVSGRADEAGVLREYEEFYAQAPELRQFEPSSKGRIEEARAKADMEKTRHDTSIDKRIEEVKKTFFVPIVPFSEVQEWAGTAINLRIAESVRANGDTAAASRLESEIVKGSSTVGMYDLVGTVFLRLGDHKVLMHDKADESNNDWPSFYFVWEGDTAGLQVGSTYDFSKTLVEVTGVTKVSYQREMSEVTDEPVLVLRRYPHSIEKIQEMWERQHSAKPRVFDPDGEAMRKFNLAEALFNANPDKGIVLLKEIVTKYPNTTASDKARELALSYQ